MTASARVAVEELVYRASLCLDDHDFEGFLALCAPTFRYAIEAYSPELRRPMIWLDHDREGLASLFRTLPKHNSDNAPLTRHVTVYTTTGEAEAGEELDVVSGLQVFRTELDGGATALFAVGKLHDRVQWLDGRPLLASRVVKLSTRRLGIGSHIPF